MIRIMWLVSGVLMVLTCFMLGAAWHLSTEPRCPAPETTQTTGTFNDSVPLNPRQVIDQRDTLGFIGAGLGIKDVWKP